MSQPLPCAVCGTASSPDALTELGALRSSIVDRLQARAPLLTPASLVCSSCRYVARAEEVMARLEAERGELSALEREAALRASEHTTIAANIEEDFASTATVGDRAADRVATFGGSWTFVLGLSSVLVLWITANVILAARAFDPFPYILLNLALSCIAAFQAPLILMSQNRQSARDRMKADQDFLVNLKAEIEVAGVHEKLDHLLHVRWQDLLELQEIQLEMLRDLVARAGGKLPPGPPGS